MTSKRWDLCVSHKDRQDKWRSTKIGVIFEGDKGQLNIKIDPGVSISTPEGVNLTGWEPKEGGRGEPRGGGGANRERPSGNAGIVGGDDDIPF